VPVQRFEFVRFAESGRVPFAELCRRFGIARSTGYKWLDRCCEEGPVGLIDRSLRPRSSPERTDGVVEALVCAVRRRFPAWGGRKIRGFLLRHGHSSVPAASTITAILRRHDLMEHATPVKRGYIRFERDTPNDLWAMDFKGDIALTEGGRCYPFGVIDDYSRYSLALVACANQQTPTVQEHLATTSDRYGLPKAILMDNGAPWGDTPQHPWNPITVWLCDLGIKPIHSRPYHPQTNGKKERLHLTLDLEVLDTQPEWETLDAVQTAFDQWNPIYNYHRPHESLGETAVPADRYQPSPRTMPASIDEPDYPDHWKRRTVDAGKRITYQGHRYRIGKPFRGLTVAVAPTTDPDTFNVYYRHHHIRTLNTTELSTMSPNARP
jgi:transposase InsO family protein